MTILIKDGNNKEINHNNPADEEWILIVDYMPARQRSNVYVNKADVSYFENPSFIDFQDNNQDAKERKAVEEMLTDALVQGLPKALFQYLRKML